MPAFKPGLKWGTFKFGKGAAEGRRFTPLGLAMLDALPPVLQESVDYQAVIHPLAKECERLAAKIELVRAQFNPGQASLLLGVWERIVRQTVNPPGRSEAERQAAVTTRLREMLALGQGFEWEAQITALIGPTWSYAEHDPADGASPPSGVLRITLGFEPGTSRYVAAQAIIRELTHAHLQLEYASAAGFVLDESRLDIEAMRV